MIAVIIVVGAAAWLATVGAGARAAQEKPWWGFSIVASGGFWVLALYIASMR